MNFVGGEPKLFRDNLSQACVSPGSLLQERRLDQDRAVRIERYRNRSLAAAWRAKTRGDPAADVCRFGRPVARGFGSGVERFFGSYLVVMFAVDRGFPLSDKVLT